MIRRETIVVVGTGVAGLSAAERLRELGWTGQIVLIGDEPHRTYHRPALSKHLLTGHTDQDRIRLRHPDELDAVWRTATVARGLDLTSRVVLLPGGERVRFDGLVIASGTEARHLPGSPPPSPRVHTLRALTDAHALDTALRAVPDGKGHVVVLGGGVLGCELASTVTERALRASIVEIAPTLLHRQLGATVGTHLTELHRRRGVRTYLDTTVTQWHHTPEGVTVRLATLNQPTATLDADLVVVAVGAIPRTEWLAGNGLDLHDGVVCSATCHVLDTHHQPLDGVVAAGDTARWPNLSIDDVPRRVEHWINAVEMGQHAATALLAGPAAATAFAPTPRFWSHQHHTRIQSIGMPALGEDTHILHGTLATGRYVAGYTRPHPDTGQPVLIGAVGIDSPRTLLDYTPRIGRPLTTAAAA